MNSRISKKLCVELREPKKKSEIQLKRLKRRNAELKGTSPTTHTTRLPTSNLPEFYKLECSNYDTVYIFRFAYVIIVSVLMVKDMTPSIPPSLPLPPSPTQLFIFCYINALQRTPYRVFDSGSPKHRRGRGYR